MDNIVEAGVKIDLHIHSQASSAKDGNKVKNNTKENIPLLIRKLSENEVNICAVTDHDTFSYEIYITLKAAESQDNSIKKVLPGVEFSVQFEVDGNNSIIHVVAIFSDDDETKIKNIESILKSKKPSNGEIHSEEEFLQILRLIDIDTILIAHQKNTLTSAKTRKNDANSLGNEKFLEFVYTDYFEAFEFKNKRNEVLNKVYLLSHLGLENKLRFITGTDCHDWSAYPADNLSEELSNFPYTYVKCLPTFKGLVMAVTDYTRLKMVNSFFNVNRKYVQCINLASQGKPINIPLSRGINVIIGDNSIGKSLLLHAMTKFNKPGTMKLLPKIKEGYKKYLKQNDLKVSTCIPQECIFCFDMQGEVRSKFEEEKLNATEFLKEYFPAPIDPRPYRNLVDNEIARMLDYLQKKFQLDTKIRKLASFCVITTENSAESLTFIQNLRKSKQKSQHITTVSSKINEITGELKQLKKLEIDQEDLDYITNIIHMFESMKQKYDKRIHQIEEENGRIEGVAKTITKVVEKHRKSISDSQKKQSNFAENTALLKDQLIEIIKTMMELVVYKPNILDTNIYPNHNQIYDYEFISKLNIEKIGTDYFKSRICGLLKKKKHIDWKTITESQLKNLLLRYDDSVPVLKFFEDKLYELIENDFKTKNSIIYHGMDKYAEMSSGLDAKIYFDLLSYESSRDGIYIIDQPEDNISQSAIKTYLLDRFKTMGENRQVIMVTHNPQFIVNLDIDNLIYIKKEDGAIQIQSGALEYVCDEYSVLDIVAQNIEGGLDSIQKRWKRYEKVTNI